MFKKFNSPLVYRLIVDTNVKMVSEVGYKRWSMCIYQHFNVAILIANHN